MDKEKLHKTRKSFICILIGTVAGIATYAFFLYFNIAIFGWNLGLLFSPLVAGYVETYLANKILDDDTGAISALILFLVTVIYGFIISNPTLGINLITLASIIIIIQAAAPTVTNYLGLVVLVGIIYYIGGFFKKIFDFIYSKIKVLFGKPEKDILEGAPTFNEKQSNYRINSKDFYYITSTDITTREYESLGYFSSTTVFERNTHIIKLSHEDIEKKELFELKQGKDKCLIRLADEIIKADGNGVVDLEINYFLNGLGGSSFQIVARGIGVKIKEQHPTF